MSNAARSLFTDFDDIDTPQSTIPAVLTPSCALLAPLTGESLPEILPPVSVGFGPQTSKLPLPSWPPMLTFELALGLDSEDFLLEKYSISRDEYDYLRQFPVFRRELANHASTIQKDGLTFRNKARVQAEAYLEEVHGIVTDTQAPASTRLDAIKSVVKWGDLEPKDTKGENQQNNQFNITISF